MYASLPDVSALEEQWRVCCERLYSLLRDKPVIRHRDAEQGTPKWVSPATALAFTCPTDELAAQRARIMEIYARSQQRSVIREASRLVGTNSEIHVVVMPSNVQAACVKLAGMSERPLHDVLYCILAAARQADSARSRACNQRGSC